MSRQSWKNSDEEKKKVMRRYLGKWNDKLGGWNADWKVTSVLIGVGRDILVELGQTGGQEGSQDGTKSTFYCKWGTKTNKTKISILFSFSQQNILTVKRIS